MSQTPPKPVSESEKAAASEFEKLAAEQHGENIVGEFLAFLGENKKWWLLPFVVLLLLLSVLIFLSSTAAAPFIYTLF